MVRLSVDLPEEVRNKLLERAQRAGSASIEDFVRTLLEDEAAISTIAPPSQTSFASVAELETKLRDGIASADTEMTDADWESLQRQVQKKR